MSRTTPTRYLRQVLAQDPSEPVRLPPLPAQYFDPVDTKERPKKDTYDGFQPIYVWKEAGGFRVVIQPSIVQEVVPKSGIDCVIVHTVLYAGDDLSDVSIPIPDGHTLVCKVQQDSEGRVKTGEDGPVLLVQAARSESAHWYPIDPVGPGSDGILYIPLYKISDVDGVAEFTFYRWGPVIIRNDLWIGKNSGGGAGVFNQHSETEGAVYYFNDIIAKYGLSISGGGNSGDITLNFDAENVDQGGNDVLVGPPDPLTDTKAQFRQIDGRDSYTDDSPDAGTTEQIAVVTDNNVPPGIIRVLGNGKVGSLIWEYCEGGTTELLAWNDGLITTTGDQTIRAGCDDGTTTTSPP